MKVKTNVFCPKCKSLDVKKEMNLMLMFGTPQKWVCNKCGFSGHLFPEIDTEKQREE